MSWHIAVENLLLSSAVILPYELFEQLSPAYVIYKTGVGEELAGEPQTLEDGRIHHCCNHHCTISVAVADFVVVFRAISIEIQLSTQGKSGSGRIRLTKGPWQMSRRAPYSNTLKQPEEPPPKFDTYGLHWS